MQPIFVGDVQGCAEELAELIRRAEAAFADAFSLWVVGDLVNRGPDNRRALELVRELVEAGRCEYVLGNHEIHLLSTALGLRELEPNDSLDDVLAAPDAKEWVDWLLARPLAVAGELAGQRFVMVHASVAPDWSADDVIRHASEAAAPLAVSKESARAFLAMDAVPGSPRDHLARITRCRSVEPGGGWSSQLPEPPARPWHEAWAERGHDYGIVYGHWALQGLHVATGLRGLDTGCVHHGRGRDGFLTAWLPDPEAASGGARRSDVFAVPDDRFWQIPACRQYYDPV